MPQRWPRLSLSLSPGALAPRPNLSILQLHLTGLLFPLYTKSPFYQLDLMSLCYHLIPLSLHLQPNLTGLLISLITTSPRSQLDPMSPCLLLFQSLHLLPYLTGLLNMLHITSPIIQLGLMRLNFPSCSRLAFAGFSAKQTSKPSCRAPSTPRISRASDPSTGT